MASDATFSKLSGADEESGNPYLKLQAAIEEESKRSSFAAYRFRDQLLQDSTVIGNVINRLGSFMDTFPEKQSKYQAAKNQAQKKPSSEAINHSETVSLKFKPSS